MLILSAAASASTSGSVSNMTGGKDKSLPSFWIPSLTPGAKATEIKKPVCTSTYNLYLSRLNSQALWALSFSLNFDRMTKLPVQWVGSLSSSKIWLMSISLKSKMETSVPSLQKMWVHSTPLGKSSFLHIYRVYPVYFCSWLQARYVCAVTNDVLGNSVPCVVLKTS